MPLLLTLTAQAPLEDVRVADVDGDGISELVLAQEDRVIERSAGLDGQLERLGRLPDEALWWDAGHGVWLVDGSSIRRMGERGALALPESSIPAGAVGGPTRAHMVVDLDRDGEVELLVWGRDQLLVARSTWPPIPLPSRTELELRSEEGGQVLATTVVPAAVAVADVEGDGVEEILVILDDVRVYGPEGERARWPLPEGLVRPADRGSQASWTTDAHWRDVDGDGRVDLLAHQLHSDGTLGGTESRLYLHLGVPGGLGPAQVVTQGSGVDDLFLVDLDADGDQDLLVPSLSLDVSNLAQAVMVRTVDVELLLLPLEQGQLQSPRALSELALPLEGDKAAWSLFEDLDGDGLPDLAVAVGTDLRVYRGLGDRVADKAWAQVQLAAPVQNLWAVDLDGDGDHELVGWAPGERRVSVVQLR